MTIALTMFCAASAFSGVLMLLLVIANGRGQQ